ncbi:MAG: ribosome maturation factor RimP [Alphaproteobacteria bacterium]|nr:ribosome maturation factor RimP [Alphaproteobacteria bacterium]
MSQKKHPVYELVEPIAEKMGFDLVRVMTIGAQNPTLQIMIERKDRKNLVVDDCAAFSRAISDLLDEKDPIDGEYSLEVSSPGIDRPLTKLEHFARFVGYEAKIETDEPIEKRKRFKGKIVNIDKDNVIQFLMEDNEYQIPFDAVSKAKLVLTDELWNEYVQSAQEEQEF